MAQDFANADKLAEYLQTLRTQYGQYAQGLWDIGIISAEHLACARYEDLVGTGVPKGYATHMMARAAEAEQHGAGVDGGTGGGGGAAAEYRAPLLHAPDTSLDIVYTRLSAVQLGAEEVGSVARITQDGLCVSAAHVWVDNGKFLNATAFDGQKMDLIASFPYFDLILLKGPPGNAFKLTTTQMPNIGTEIIMMAHPAAPRQTLKGMATPVVCWGRIAAVDQAHHLAAADQHGAMPNASGAPVCYDTQVLAGVHLGTSFHLDRTHDNSEEALEEVAPQDRVDRDKDNMWSGSNIQSPHGKKRRKPVGSSASRLTQEDLASRVLHAVLNIQHKDQLALFCPSPFHRPSGSQREGLGALRPVPDATGPPQWPLIPS